MDELDVPSSGGLDTRDGLDSVAPSSTTRAFPPNGGYYPGGDTGSILGGLSTAGLRTATAGAGSPVPAGCAPLVEYSSRSYHAMTAKVYNTLTGLIRHLKVPWLAFSTAMHYYHTFLEARGSGSVDCLLFGVTCLFLACKSENITRGAQLKRILPVVFETPEGTEDYKLRKAQVEALELMLCHTLDFHFHVDHPQNHMESLLTAVGASVGTPFHSNSHRFLMYAAHTPLCTRSTPDEVAESVFLLVGGALGMIRYDDVSHLLKTSEDRLLMIQNTIRQFLVMAEKKTGVAAIDAATKRSQRKRRRETKTPTPQFP